MAEDKKKEAAAKGTQADEPVDTLSTFAQEYEEDNKILKRAFIIAVIFHVILLIIHFPDLPALGWDAEEDKVYVIEQVRFKPPPPRHELEIPKPRAQKVPIPDPTPDEPEPIRDPEDVPDVDLPDTDMIFDIPEGPPPEPSGPMQVGGDVQAPVRIHYIEPRYPEVARKARLQGVVIVQAIVNTSGEVENVRVLRGLGMGLDQAAVDAVKQWRFQPATLHGRPVPVYYNLTVNFQLQ